MLADTGYWLALANPRDAWHHAAVAATRQLSEPLVVTWPVVTEACHLLGRYGRSDSQARFLTVVRASAAINPQDGDDLAQMGNLMAKYRDRPMDLADASLVAAAAELRNGRILTTDERDFDIYRWNDTQPFQNELAISRRR